MLEDAGGIRRVVLACGFVDLRKGIDGLATIIGDRYGQNPLWMLHRRRQNAGRQRPQKWHLKAISGILFLTKKKEAACICVRNILPNS